MLAVCLLAWFALPRAAQAQTGPFPGFLGHPQSQTVPAGSDVTFTFAATNYSSALWLFNGTNLVTGAPSPLISSGILLTNVQAGDAGDYTVVIGGMVSEPPGWAWATSQVATLTVLPCPPAVLSQTAPYTASLGLPASLTVTARGTEPIEYQWQFNGTSIPFATNATLLLSNVQPADAGDYSVLLSNADAFRRGTNIALAVGPVVKWGAEQTSAVFPPDLPMPYGLSNVQAIAASDGLSAALDPDAGITAWGTWSGAAAVSNLTSWPRSIAAMAAAPPFVFALNTNGTVATLGLARLGPPLYLIEPPTNRPNIISVCGGYDYSLVLQADGTPAIFGRRDLEPPEWATKLVAIAGAEDRVVGLRSDGTVVGWSQVAEATNVPAGLQGVTQVAVGSQYSFALKTDGTLVAWDLGGALVQPPLLTNVVAVSACGAHTVALTADGSVLESWDAINFTNPLPALSNLVAVAAGATHALALEGDGKPSFTEQPMDQTAVAGNTSILRAQAVGAQPLRLQWQLNGADIPAATNWFLAQTAITPDAAGGYTLVAGNDFGACTSRVARLQVLVPPTITLQPTNQLVAIGDTVSLSVQAAGPGPLAYHWKKDNRDLADDARITGTAADTLTIANANQRDTGVYRVEVSNADGSVSSHLVVLQVGQTTLAAWGENFYGQTYVPPEMTNIIALVCGTTTFAVTAEGTLTWWGGERSGDYLPVFTPPGLSNLVALAAGRGLIALRNDGTVVEWGDGDQPPAGLKDVVAIAGAPDHYLALKADGTVAAWTPWRDPSMWWRCGWVPPDLTNVVAISGSQRGDLALKADGTLTAWQAAIESPSPWPHTVPAGLTNVIAIASTEFFNFALKANGSVTAWADLLDSPIFASLDSWTNIIALSGALYTCLALNSAGTVYAVTDGFPDPSVPASLTNVVAAETTGSSSFALVGESAPCISTQPLGRTVAPGSDVSFRVTASGSQPMAYQWRLNELPIPGATNSTLILSNAQSDFAGLYSVTASNSLGCVTSTNARLDLGPVLAWGINFDGLLDVPPGLTNGVAIATKTFHALLLDERGTVSGWGTFWDGQAVPTNLANVKALAAGSTFDLALHDDGSVTSWGLRVLGEPNLPPGLTNVAAIAAGAYHGLALKADGSVLAWGDNSNGQTNVPPGLSNVVAIAAGDLHSLALKADGSVVLWGGDFIPAGTLPPDLTNVVAIEADSEHSLALRADGTVAAWGGDGAGQTDVPADLTNVVAIAAGAYHSLALKADGTVVSWGVMHDLANVPPQASNVVAVAACLYSGYALLGDGRPHITIQPFSHTVTRCSTLTLNARAVGAGLLSYQWQRNGTNLPGATSASLTLDNLQAEDAAAYRCLVSNAQGSALTDPATVAVEPLRFDTSPGALLADVGAIRLRVLGLSGRAPLVLYATTNFQAWEPILTNPPALGPLDLWVPRDPARPRQFYRAAEVGLPPKTLSLQLLSLDTQASTNRVRLRLRGLTGQGPSVVFASPDLLSWQPFLTNPPTFGELDFVDQAPAAASARFYRATEQGPGLRMPERGQ